MTTCSRCGAEVVLREAPSGRLAYYDMTPPIHWRTCKKRPKRPVDERVEALRALGYNTSEAKEMLKGIRPGDPDWLRKALLNRLPPEERKV